MRASHGPQEFREILLSHHPGLPAFRNDVTVIAGRRVCLELWREKREHAGLAGAMSMHAPADSIILTCNQEGPIIQDESSIRVLPYGGGLLNTRMINRQVKNRAFSGRLPEKSATKSTCSRTMSGSSNGEPGDCKKILAGNSHGDW